MAKKDEASPTAQANALALHGAQIGGAAVQAPQMTLGDDQGLYGAQQLGVGAGLNPYSNAAYATRAAREQALGAAMGLKPENAVAALRAAKKFETFLLTGVVEE